jgi:RHS repeat-associated protein
MEFYENGGGATAKLSWSSASQAKQTAKERDVETGLDNFGARFYSSTQGRFTSPDQPFMDQEEGDPQSWNLYSYVRNNPLR